MSKTLDQIYIANPSTTMLSTDLLYLVHSPYTSGQDSAITYANLAKAALTNAVVLAPTGTQTITGFGLTAPTLTAATTITATAGAIQSLASSIIAGSSGNAGSAVSYSPGASLGTLSLTSANNAGNFGNVITNASTASARTWTFPDASGTVALTSGASGIVSSGTINQLTYYAATGTTVSGLATANNGVLITSAGGVPSISSTLPSGITLVAPVLGTPASGTLTNATGLPIAGITGLGTGVATALAGTVTGTGGISLTDSPVFTTKITSPTVVTTGAANTQKQFTANSGASITIDPANGAYQTITLTANTTITLTSLPSSTTEREFILELLQDGTGSRTVAWSNITFVNNGGASPAINGAIGGSTYIGVSGTNSAWIGYSTNQGLGVTDASNAPAGYIGEVISSSVAIGSAISMTTATGITITSIALTPGDWSVSGNIGFIAAAGTLPTVLTASISATNNTQATSPNGGAFAQLGLAFTAASTNVLDLAPTRINISAAATYYLVGTATFTVSTLTGYGSITARRIR